MGRIQKLVLVFLAAITISFMGLTVGAHAQEKTDSIKVCFVEIVENDAFNSMMDGFRKRMAEEGLKDVQYDVKCAQGDMPTLNSIAGQLKNSDYDLIVPIATPAAQAVVNAKLDIPSVFISITDPFGAGLIEDLDHPNKNITGTSNKTPVDEIYETAESLIDNLKSEKLGILYCSGEKNSQVTVDEMVEYLDRRNISYVIKTIQNSSEANQATAALAKQCPAIFVPMDSVVQSAMITVASTALSYNSCILGSDPVMVRSGALLSVACDNETIGRYSADLAIDVLENKNIEEVGVLDVIDNQKLINTSVLNALNLNKDKVDGAVYYNGETQGSTNEILANPIFKAVELGLEYGLLAIGVFITFRILNIADLTVDGSFCLGMAISAVLSVAGHPILGLILGFIASGVAGVVTAELIVRADIEPLLAGIITMTGLYSINTFILQGPNVSLLGSVCVQDLFADMLHINSNQASFLLIILFNVVVIALLTLYFSTESGLGVRACGNNEAMCRASSINTNLVKVAGLALSNALVGLSGGLVANFQGFGDVSCGSGMVMIGLASVIIGEVFTSKSSILKGLIFSVVGSVVYRVVIQVALSLNLIDANALKLITALIVALFMLAPKIKKTIKNKDTRAAKSNVKQIEVSQKALLLKDITKTFARGSAIENKVIRDLNLELLQGDFACVVGSNGAGKSTLFNIIAGSISEDSGEVYMAGEAMKNIPDYKRAKRISRVFQDPSKGTAPDLTVAENIALAYGRSRNTTLSKAMKKDVRELIYEELKSLGFGLEERMDTKVGMLSGGQRQAVTLLMATIAEPDLLLLDEHTAALDPEATIKIMQLTEDICKRKNITTLMITHDLNYALRAGNKTLVMDEGQIVAVLDDKKRQNASIQSLLEIYKKKTGKSLATDKMLLTK